MHTARASVDLIKEFRLRRWARDHYVPLEMRRSAWHPVVLEEMALRDGELASRGQETHRPAPLSAYVPLLPDSGRMLHPPHADVPRPAFMSLGAGDPARSMPREQACDSIFIPG